MKKLAIDLDSTVWQILDIFVPLYNKKYKTNVKVGDIDRFHFFPQERFMKIYKKTTKHIKEFKPVRGFFGSYIEELSILYDITFLTHGNYTKKKVSKKLESMGVWGDFYQDIIITKEPKADFDFDYFIDDNPLMVADMKQYPEKTLILIPTTYNYYIADEYDNILRWMNWKQITEYLITGFI